MKTYVKRSYDWCVVRPLSLVYVLACVMIAVAFQNRVYIWGCIAVLTGAAFLAGFSMVRRELSRELGMLAEQAALLEIIRHEFEHNGGGATIRDAIERVERKTEAAAKLASDSAEETRIVVAEHLLHVAKFHDGGEERRHRPPREERHA